MIKVTCPTWRDLVSWKGYPIRILIADDFEDWRRLVCQLLEGRPDLQVICEVADGMEAVQSARELKPDLILLDIGLPRLNGLGAARHIRQLSPESKILFLSQETTADVVQEALGLGALGYVAKAYAGSELLLAIDAVFRGERFVGKGIEGHGFTETLGGKARHRHEVQFYSDDEVFLASFTRFIADALRTGNAALVFATKSHRDGLVQRLKAERVDVDAAIQRGTYISLDAADTLSSIMVNGLLDPARVVGSLNDLIEVASKAAIAEHPRVALCGERVGLLWVEGKTDAAIQLEQLCTNLAKTHELDILCAYPLSSIHGGEDEHGFRRICAQHSAVYSQ